MVLCHALMFLSTKAKGQGKHFEICSQRIKHLSTGIGPVTLGGTRVFFFLFAAVNDFPARFRFVDQLGKRGLLPIGIYSKKRRGVFKILGLFSVQRLFEAGAYLKILFV